MNDKLKQILSDWMVGKIWNKDALQAAYDLGKADAERWRGVDEVPDDGKWIILANVDDPNDRWGVAMVFDSTCIVSYMTDATHWRYVTLPERDGE